MNMLVAMASPISAVASFPAGTKATFFAPAASTMSACRLVPRSCQSGFFTKSAVGDTVAFTGTLVRLSVIFDRASEAESLEAGIVLVARGLVDGAVATEIGLEWLDRKAIRLDAAIAAAFTDHLVDDHAPGGIGELFALSAPALFCGAVLHVNTRRND